MKRFGRSRPAVAPPPVSAPPRAVKRFGRTRPAAVAAAIPPPAPVPVAVPVTPPVVAQPTPYVAPPSPAPVAAPEQPQPQQVANSEEQPPQEAAAPQEQAPQEQGEQQQQEQAPQEQGEQQQKEPATPEAGYEAPRRRKSKMAAPLVQNHVRDGRLYTCALLITPQGVKVLNAKTLAPDNTRNGTLFGTEGRAMAPLMKRNKKRILQQAKGEKLKELARQVVERARQGDQNAMAIIAGVRDNNRKGNPRAAASFMCIRDYITKNPIVADQFGAEQKAQQVIAKAQEDGSKTVLNLANGPTITNPRIRHIAKQLGPNARVFIYGMQNATQGHKLASICTQLHMVQQGILEAGRLVGEAIRLQQVRQPGSSLSAYSPDIGWELGE